MIVVVVVVVAICIGTTAGRVDTSDSRIVGIGVSDSSGINPFAAISSISACFNVLNPSIIGRGSSSRARRGLKSCI